METLKPRIASSPIDAWSWSQKADEYRRLSNSLGGDDPGRVLGAGRVASSASVPKTSPLPLPQGCSSGFVVESNDTDFVIPPGPSIVTSTIEVSGQGRLVWDVDVQTFITHSFAADLDIGLISPSGRFVTLTTDNGGSADDVFNGTIWDAQADPGGQVPYGTNQGLVTDHVFTSGVTATTLSPEESLSAFFGARFRGDNPNGTWTLFISDDSAVSGGMLHGWNLRITTLSSQPGGGYQFHSGSGISIPSGPGVVTSTIAVPAAGTTCGVRVFLHLDHTNPEDLDMTLQSPSGTVATLSSDNGEGEDDEFAEITFSDEADFHGELPYSVNEGLVTDFPYTDPDPPSNVAPEEGLGVFQGEPGSGDWTLTISDDSPGDGGQLNSWVLELVDCSCTDNESPMRADERPSGGASDQNGVAEPGERFVFESRVRNTGPSFGEHFDGVAVRPPNVPFGWTSLLFLGQAADDPWQTVSDESTSPPRSVFAPAPGHVTDNRLTSPVWFADSAARILYFRHHYSFHNGFDGGVLEVSVGGGTFQDILDAGAVFLTGGYTGTLSSCCSNPLSGRQAWTGATGGFVGVTVVLPDALVGIGLRFRFRLGTDTGFGALGWYIDNVALGGNPAGPVTGTVARFFSPAATATAFSVPDGTAAFGSIDRTASNGCFEATGDCYELAIGPLVGPRPTFNGHWDGQLQDDLNIGGHLTYYVHIGDSFTDVPRGSPYYRFIETLFHKGVTAGCGAFVYCPTSDVLREQMAVFLLRSRPLLITIPPCTVPAFDDVPCTSPYAPYINQISLEGITAGCGGGNFCPASPVLREQMAVFLLLTLEGTGYTPPSCTMPMFGDVPCTSPYAIWINELARRGITGGCGGGNYCPALNVTREQMAVFLSVTFTMQLY
jgi:subtilisin-like proprotein convertase family protein